MDFNIEYVRSVPVARSTRWGPGIARISWTSKLAEASRRIWYVTLPDAHAPIKDRLCISTRHLPFAAFLTNPMKFSRFQRVKKERRVNASLLCLLRPRPLDPLTGPLLWWRSVTAKVRKIYQLSMREINFELIIKIEKGASSRRASFMGFYGST